MNPLDVWILRKSALRFEVAVQAVTNSIRKGRINPNLKQPKPPDQKTAHYSQFGHVRFEWVPNPDMPGPAQFPGLLGFLPFGLRSRGKWSVMDVDLFVCFVFIVYLNRIDWNSNFTLIIE